MSLTTKQMLKINDLFTKASAEDFDMIRQMFNDAQRQFKAARSADAKAGLTVGDVVKFDAGRQGGIIEGVISKVNRVKARIDCGILGTWNVPFSMLEKA